MSGPETLGLGAIAAAASLILVNGLLSLWLRLRMERQLLVASARSIVQLTLLGYILVPVFGWGQPLPVLALAVLMVVMAARASVGRVTRSYPHASRHAFVSLLIAGGVTAWIGTGLIVRPEPWWQPRYLLPFLGMILGNSLTGVSLGLDTCLERLDVGRGNVEALLAAGATRQEAALPVARESIRVAMVPIINAMTVVGLVSIPGMMTGQLLGGTAPDQAARYQILILFLIAAGTGLGAGLAILFALRSLFDGEHRLRADRLVGASLMGGSPARHGGR